MERLRLIAGQYQIIRELGSGGMGTVYLARDVALHRVVALKLMREDLAEAGSGGRDAFVREAQLAARLEHPSIVPVYAFGEDEGRPFLVMRYLSGGSLGERLRSDGPFPPETARRILADLAAALAHAHREGVVHRDLKPDNIFFDGPADVPRVLIGDFGVAFRPTADAGPGQRRLLYGTPHFMSPEQAVGEFDLDGRSDIFSLGVIGYYLVSGALPYEGSSVEAINAARAREERTPLMALAPDAPDDLVRVINRCLAPEPGDRWPDATQLERALRAEAPSAPAEDRSLRRRLRTGRRAAATEAATTLAAVPSVPRPVQDTLMHAPLREFRFAFRSLRRTPLVTGAALLCLALGLGATTAIFSAVNTALLKPLPFEDPERLVAVFRTTPQFSHGPFAPANFLDLQAGGKSLEGLAGIRQATGLLEVGGQSFRVTAYEATGDLFSLLGATALRGRLLLADDDRLDQPNVAVVSEELWRERYSADPALVGRDIRLDSQAYTVVGILPADFRIPFRTASLRSDVWLPIRFTPDQAGQRRNNYLRVLGRRARGRSVAQVEAELVGVMDQIVEAHPEVRGESLQVGSLQSEAAGPVRAPLLLMLGAVGLVLLIAAANVASLILARGVERRQEIAIRAALGASRWAIMKGVLFESILISGGGVILGLGLAWVGIQVIGATAADLFPQFRSLQMDLRVVLFAVVLTGVVAVWCGLAPAWRVSATDPQEALRAGGVRTGSGRSQHRLLNLLVAGEVGVSIILLLGAGLLLRGFVQLLDRDPGFDPAPLVTLVVDLQPERYRDAQAAAVFLEPALTAIRTLPGVEAAGAISLIPYENWGWNFNIRYEGVAGDDPTTLPLTENRVVSPGFFETLRMTLVRGRMFTPEEGRVDAAPVVIANQALVDRDFPGEDPIGKRFHIGDTTFATIVGVVANIRNMGPFSDPRPEIYWDVLQLGNPATAFPLVIRTAVAPTSVIPAVTEAIRRVDPGAAVSRVKTMETIIRDSVGQPRFYTILLGSFAGVALLLSLAGLYGVISYAVARRTREIGIRVALGATKGSTVGLIVREAMTLVGAGIVAGGLAAAGLTRLLQSQLFGVSPLHAGVWAAALGGLAAAALLAVLVPAGRAANVEPIVAIRHE